ncbi:MAG: LCP family protein [Clostridium sp.]|nr:LCP family protein [Clostridium sp.]
MKKNKRSIKIAARAGIVLAILAAAVGGGYFLLWQLGRISLLRGAVSKAPSLTGDAPAQEELPEQIWEEDWIRYQGGVYAYNEKIRTFLFMGIDVKGGLGEEQTGLNSGQADALFLLVMDQDTKRLTVIGIDRNTMADFDMYDENGKYISTVYAQIALAHGYGDGRVLSAENTVKAVSGLLYDIPIHGYCAANMEAIVYMNDAVGGVDVVSTEEIQTRYYRFRKGEPYHLIGDLAYWYLRHRDVGQEESARGRLERQKQYLTAYVRQAKKALRQEVTLPARIFRGISQYMVTDITLEEAVYLASSAAGYSFSEEDLLLIPGTTDLTKEYDEFYPDEAQLKDMIINVFYVPVETDGK